MYFVYVILCNSGEFYKGFTNNIEIRLNEHLNGKVRYTKNLRPLKLIHAEICETRNDARSLEKFFKTGYGREVIDEIAGEHAVVVEW